MNIGFIGFGNIAKAMVSGLLLKDSTMNKNIYASAAHLDKLKENTEKFGINYCSGNKELVDISDIIFICCKPYQVKDVMEGHNYTDKIVISFAAGLSFDDLSSIIPDAHIMISIPNTAISVGKGIHIVNERHSLTDDEYHKAMSLLEMTGYVSVFDDSKASIASTISGCTPAYTAMYMEALGDAACRYGLKRDEAYPLIAHMLEGFGAMAYASSKHPGILKDEVCSPNGTTIKGVASLEKDGFRGDVINAIDAVMTSKNR